MGGADREINFRGWIKSRTMKRNTVGTEAESPEEARKGGDRLTHQDGEKRIKERIRGRSLK